MASLVELQIRFLQEQGLQSPSAWAPLLASLPASLAPALLSSQRLADFALSSLPSLPFSSLPALLVRALPLSLLPALAVRLCDAQFSLPSDPSRAHDILASWARCFCRRFVANLASLLPPALRERALPLARQFVLAQCAAADAPLLALLGDWLGERLGAALQSAEIDAQVATRMLQDGLEHATNAVRSRPTANPLPQPDIFSDAIVIADAYFLVPHYQQILNNTLEVASSASTQPTTISDDSNNHNNHNNELQDD